MNKKLAHVFDLCGMNLTEEVEQNFYEALSERTRMKLWGSRFEHYLDFDLTECFRYDFPNVRIGENINADYVQEPLNQTEINLIFDSFMDLKTHEILNFSENIISQIKTKDNTKEIDGILEKISSIRSRVSESEEIQRKRNIATREFNETLNLFYDFFENKKINQAFTNACKMARVIPQKSFLFDETVKFYPDQIIFFSPHSFSNFLELLFRIKNIKYLRPFKDTFSAYDEHIFIDKTAGDEQINTPKKDMSNLYDFTNRIFIHTYRINFTFGKKSYIFNINRNDLASDGAIERMERMAKERGGDSTGHRIKCSLICDYNYKNRAISPMYMSDEDLKFDSLKNELQDLKINLAEYEALDSIGDAYLYFLAKHNKELHIKILKAIFEKIAIFRQPPPILSESDLEKHVYICASSGSGKSELIKKLVHSCALSMKRKKMSAIVIEPHGELVADILALRSTLALENRVFYIDASLFGEKVFCINPFDIRPNTSDFKIQSIAEQLTNTFCSILGNETALSLNMKALLLPCIQVLLRLEGATFKDLQIFMDDSRNAHLVNLGRSLPFHEHADFFDSANGKSFFAKSYDVTKNALYTKLQSLLNSEMFVRITCGRSSVDFEHEIDQGALFLFNLSKGRIGAESSEVVGRLIISMLSSIALGREEQPKHLRTPTYIFVDEVQNFVSGDIETILTEARKYKMFLTSANQVIGQDMDTQLKDVLLSSGVIFGGMNNASSISTIARNINAEPESFKSLRMGEFMMYRKMAQKSEMVKVNMVNDKGDYKKALAFATSAYTSPTAGRKATIEANQANTRKVASQEALNNAQGPKFSR